MDFTLRRRSLHYLLVPLGLLLAGYVALGLWIGHDVQATARDAQARYGGTTVVALSRLVDDAGRPLRARDRAVWALGQIGDPAALPVLERQVTGLPCDHGSALCQHELSKAIAACQGGLNLAAVVWRRFYDC